MNDFFIFFIKCMFYFSFLHHLENDGALNTIILYAEYTNRPKGKKLIF